MRKLMMLILAGFLLLVVTATPKFAQIYSTATGGAWDNSSTWEGGNVPGENASVVIQGKVEIKYYTSIPSKLTSITITTDGFLDNSSTGIKSFEVSGDVIVNGTNYETDFKIHGALTVGENANWLGDAYFVGSDNHNLSISDGASFNGKIYSKESAIIATSDIYIDSGILIAKEFNLGGGWNLFLHNTPVGVDYTSSADSVKMKIVGANSSIYMSGGGSIYRNCDLVNVNLKGMSRIGHDVNFVNVVNVDTLIGYDYYSRIATASTYEDFVNNGVITSVNGSHRIIFSSYGNIENNGAFNYGEVHLVGEKEQQILLPNDNVITAKIVMDANIEGSSYQWQKDGANIDYKTSKTLTFSGGFTTNDYGTYQCIVDGTPSRKIIVGNSKPAAFEITNVQITNLTDTTTQVTWQTTVPTTGFIFYAENDTSSGFPMEAMEPSGYLTKHSLTLENLITGSTYYFIIDQNDSAFNNIRAGTFKFVAGDTTTGVNNFNKFPVNFSLSQNYPNPFSAAGGTGNPTTTIKYSIPNVAHELSVHLIVYDILGRKVATLVNKVQTSGNYSVKFDASNLSSGIYLYKLQSGNFINTKKMLLIK